MNLTQGLLTLLIAILMANWCPIFKNKNGESKMGIDLKAIKKSYGTDLKASVEGKWFSISMIDGVEVKVAKSGNPNYERLARNLYKPYQDRLRRKGSLSEKITETIHNKLLVETLLLDWKGMPGENGKEVVFSKEEAMKLISDPELKEIKEEILGFSDNFSAFRLVEDEELEGNLEIS